MGLDGEAGVVEDREPVHDVGAELGIYVLCPVLAKARSVPCPVGEVTHNLKYETVLLIFYLYIDGTL